MKATQSRTQFSALHQDPDDESHVSIEMLNMSGIQDHQSTKSSTWMVTKNTRKPTMRENWSPFPWKCSIVVLLLPLALAPIVVLSIVAEEASQSYIRGLDCYPNGLWKYATDATWEIMDSSYFFTPNLSFGKMTFTQVKVIDIAWDLLIGRGGQLLLAWVNYRVFNEYIVWHMECYQTSYKFYAALAFQTTTLGTLGVLGKEFLAFSKGKFWKSLFRWLAIVGMFLSTLYVLSFPTLMAAMTGYIAKTEPYIEDFDSNLIALDKLDVVQFVVNDAQRIGYEKPLVAVSSDHELISSMRNYVNAIANGDLTARPNDAVFNPLLQPRLLLVVNKTSEWVFGDKSTRLPTPSLNITIHTNFPQEISLAKALDADRQYEFAFSSGRPTFDSRQSTVYNKTYLINHGSCKPSETYQWGFSYIFLFMVSIFNFVWACIMVGMWLDTRRGSRMYKSGRRPGLLRSLMEFSRVVREEVGGHADLLVEEELKERLSISRSMLVVPKNELRIRRIEIEEHDGARKRSWTRNLTRGSTF